MTDEEIVKLVEKGDKDKFGVIIERYQRRLFGYLKNLTNQRTEEIEDILADVFISVYINLHGFDTKKKFSSWIFRVAHNKAIDFFKKRKIKTETIDESEELIGDGKKLFEEIEIEKEMKKVVGQAIDKLELKYKEVVVLYYFEDKNYEEISEILRVPQSNVGVLLFRAKKMLKEKLKDKVQ